MQRFARRPVAITVIIGFLVCLVPCQAGSPAGPARLEGRVVGTDGRPAEGLQVLLIDTAGSEVAAAETDASGVYSFERVEAGSYSLGLANAEGQRAPVAGAPVQLADHQLARRDLKIVQADVPSRDRATADYDPSVGVWWAGLSTPAKAWVVVAIIVAGWFTYEALTGGNETPASPN